MKRTRTVRRGQGTSAGIAVTAGILLSLAGVALAAAEGSFSTPQEVTMAGLIGAQIGHGAAHFLGTLDALGPASLQAERLTIDYSYAAGTRYQLPTGAPLLDTGPVEEARIELTNALASIQGWQDSPQILILDEQGAAVSNANAFGRTVAYPISDATIVRVGNSPNAVATGGARPHGFWYEVEEPQAVLAAADEVTISGTFTVFVNNVTVEGSSDEGPFDRWSGRREHVDDTGTRVQYESYVVLLQVTNGTLRLAAPDAIALIAPRMDVTLNGILTAERATGELVTGSARRSMDGTPIELRGQGRVEFAVDGTSDARRSPPRLQVASAGPYEITAPGAAVTSAELPSQRALSWVLPPALVLVMATLVVTLGLPRSPLRRFVEGRVLNSRERRVTTWLHTGDRLMKVHKFDRAAVWYRRVTDRYPDSAEGWQSLATCLDAAGDGRGASEAYERVARLLGDDPHSLVAAAQSAMQAGDTERAVVLLVDAAREDPGGVRHVLVSSPQWSPLRSDARIARLLANLTERGAAYV